MKSLKEAAQKIAGGVQPISMLSLAQILNLSSPISLKTICNDADFYGKYVFKLDNFTITNTRSRSSDTDYVSFTLKVGDNQPQTQIKSMGDVKNDTYNVGRTFNVGLEFGPITITDPNTTVKFNYQIINAGHTTNNEVTKVLETAACGMINATGDIIAASFAGGIWGIIIGGTVALATLGLGELVSFLTADCDGLVAVDQVAVTGATLKNWLSSSSSHSETRYYPGTNSPAGCGPHNSQYYVTWTVS